MDLNQKFLKYGPEQASVFPGNLFEIQFCFFILTVGNFFHCYQREREVVRGGEERNIDVREKHQLDSPRMRPGLG